MEESNSVLLQISPILLLAAVLAIALWAFIATKKYSNTNDFAKSLTVYLVGVVPYAVVFVLLGLPLFICLLCAAMGFVVLSAVSNHYFYH